MSGAVVVVHEALGVTPWVRGVAERFEAEGYKTAVPHLYSRIGDPVFEHPHGFSKAREAMATLTGASILEDVDAAIESTGVRKSRVAVVGFCMGGAVALYAGAMRALGAAVSFYGGGITTPRWEGVPPLVEVAPGLRSPWLGLYGTRDESIPVEHVDALEAAARLAPVPTRVERYDAGHGFVNESLPDLYSKESAEAAWPLALTWLRQNLPT